MSFGEIAWRVGEKLHLVLDYWHAYSWCGMKWKGHRDQLAQRGAFFHTGNSATPELISIFDLKFPLNQSFDWHHDYDTGTQVDKKFASFIDIRDTRVVGDIKYIWEINRHQYLSAQMYMDSAPESVLDTLVDWVENNPPFIGINWSSSLEFALRIISWALILDRFIDDTRADAIESIVNSADKQLHYIDSHLSRYSSANNHLIGEVVGLYVGSMAFPWLSSADRWRKRAKDLLEREILKQITPDGVNREQTTAYQLFTAEFFLMAVIFGRNQGDGFSDEFLTRLKAMLEYLVSIATNTAVLPDFGDSDDGRGFILSYSDTNFQSVMQLGGILFKEPSYLRFNNQPGETLKVLLGDSGVEEFHSLKKVEFTARKKLFPEGGKAILGSVEEGLWVVADFGDHGYTRIAAHAHADALSFVVGIGDDYFLIDPGTYTYNSHQKWRDYFRGTSAHNTVRIDGLEQSEMGGRFMWNTHATSKLVDRGSIGESEYLTMEHDGYLRLQDPVLHRRKLHLDKEQGMLEIHDRLECGDTHQMEIYFHLHEDTEIVSQNEHMVVVKYCQYSVKFSGSIHQGKFKCVLGSNSPPNGWRSKSFHKKVECPTLIYSRTIKGSIDNMISISFKRESK